MEPLRFNVIQLTPERTREEITKSHWSSDGTALIKSGTYRREGRLSSTQEGIEGLAHFDGLKAGHRTLHYYVSQERVWNNQGKLVTKSLGVSVSPRGLYRPLIFDWAPPEEIGDAIITGALLGDYNRDGKTDILVQLSNGGSFVFEQTDRRHPALKPGDCYALPGAFLELF